jgi:hypothetical protein
MSQYNLLILVFAAIGFVKLRQSAESALLDVFLPVLLLVPAIYFLHIPHLPPLSCYDVVLLPLGAAALLSRSHNWRFHRTDLWVIAFAVADFITDYINLGMRTAVYDILDPGFLGGVFAYFIGKMMIEQTGYREKFVRRVVVLLGAVGFLSVTEFFLHRNLFVVLTHRFFGRVDYWGDQYRSGFLRVKGPFMGAEEAGMVFLIGFCLSLWLWYVNRNPEDVPEPRLFGIRRSTLCVAGIVLGLAMTLSRGPMLGAVAAYLIARIGLVKKKRMAALIAVLLIGAGALAAHQRAASLSRLDNQGELVAGSPDDEAKASAAYRTRLYEVYKPVAEKGGLFGWSAAAFPRDITFWSIDNEYLLLWVAQGQVGLSLFILIVTESLLALFQAILRAQHPEDLSFYYCMAGMLIGLLLVLGTVFLGGQGYVLFFLCSGWIQALPDNEWVARRVPEFAFRRVYQGAV